jgi:gamma-tubulin complex component 4
LSDLQAFSAAISKVQNLREFNSQLFSKVIETIGECVAKKLWNLVVQKADLLKNLHVLKEYYLLAKGEFYLVLIEEARHLFSLPPSAKAEFEINTGPVV